VAVTLVGLSQCEGDGTRVFFEHSGVDIGRMFGTVNWWEHTMSFFSNLFRRQPQPATSLVEAIERLQVALLSNSRSSTVYGSHPLRRQI
jgi:hypothetical protein